MLPLEYMQTRPSVPLTPSASHLVSLHLGYSSILFGLPAFTLTSHALSTAITLIKVCDSFHSQKPSMDPQIKASLQKSLILHQTHQPPCFSLLELLPLLYAKLLKHLLTQGRYSTI